MHVSDCSFHDCEECDCGGLDLASYVGHSFVASFIASTGRFGFFVDHMGRECFVEPHELPALTLAAIASTSNLPDAHDAIAVLRGANGMNLDDAREAVVAKFKAKAFD
ncbi:hypothetical protein AB9E15_29975 [Rhizobium leguminosarum]|uniref:hypothetical protein n=1 Tax=Rhizobium leguminosarum TaxID=384 RepID=UPI003F9A68CD